MYHESFPIMYHECFNWLNFGRSERWHSSHHQCASLLNTEPIRLKFSAGLQIVIYSDILSQYENILILCVMMIYFHYLPSWSSHQLLMSWSFVFFSYSRRFYVQAWWCSEMFEGSLEGKIGTSWECKLRWLSLDLSWLWLSGHQGICQQRCNFQCGQADWSR